MDDTPPFASTREALGMLRTVLGYLGAGASEMAAQAQAECLQELEQLDAVKTATRAEILGAFTAAQGFNSWLIWPGLEVKIRFGMITFCILIIELLS